MRGSGKTVMKVAVIVAAIVWLVQAVAALIHKRDR
jgi:hypothetical protein